MKIIEILDKDLLIENLNAKSKIDLLRELSLVIVEKNKGIGLDEIMEVLLEREKLGSTGIGDGVAIPHGKLPGLDKLLISFGRSKDGIEFDSIDNKPAHLFFLLIAPENSTGAHLKALARISRLLKDTSFRKRLLEAKDKDEIYNIMKEEDEKN